MLSGSEVTARQVIGSCEGNKQSLSAGVKGCDGGAQNRGERPIRVEFNGSVVASGPVGFATAMLGRVS